MKHNILKSLFISIILLIGVSNAWAYNFGNDYGKNQVTIWFDNSTTQLSDIKIHFWQDNGANKVDWAFTHISGTDYWYINTNYAGFKGFKIHGTPKNTTDNWGWETNERHDEVYSGWYARCISPNSTDKNSDITWTVPGLKNVTFTNTTTAADILAGTGTNSNPYIIKPNTKITVKLNGDLIDSQCSKSYKFGTSNATTTQTHTVNSSATAGAAYNIEGFTGATRDKFTSRYASAGTLYFKTAYSISASANGGHGTVAITSGGTYVYQGNTTFQITATPDEGYEIDTWTVTGGTTTGTGNTITVEAKNNSNVTAEVTFKGKNYTITLDPQNGESTSTITATYGSAMPKLNTLPTRDGYTFGGYYTETNGDGTQYYKADGSSAKNWNIAEDKTLYAKWSPITYNIDYENLCGASHKNPTTYTAEQEFSFFEPTTTRNGYNFAGWYPAGIERGTTGNITVTATWTEQPAKTIYFKPSDWWKKDGAKSAIYAWVGNDNTWIDFDYDDCTGDILTAEIPAKYTQIIIARLIPSSHSDYNSTNNGYSFANAWNQTSNLSVPTNNNNLYDISKTNNQDDCDYSRWTTYTAPTYKVSIEPCQNGTIKVVYNGQTYTSGAANVTINNIPIHSELTITFTPAEGYELTSPAVTYADIVAENTYSICGPAVISAEFIPQGTTKTIYLRPNEDWLKDDAIFIAHAWKNGSSDQHDYLMTTKDTDYTGSYSCTIDSKYDHVVFARINPEHKDNQELSAEWMWNKTIDLQITDDILKTNGYRFAIGAKVGGTGDNKDFYNGTWEQNTPIWSLSADFNQWHAEDAIFMGYPGKINNLLVGGEHQLLLYNIIYKKYYRNEGTYTRAHSGQWWTTVESNEGNNLKMIADVDRSNYLFQLQFATQTGTFKNQLSIIYPTSGGYMLAYKDGDTYHPAHYIEKETNEALRLDTISFFVNHEKDPEIRLLQQTAGITGLTKWETKRTYTIGSTTANDIKIDSTGVFNFVLKQTNNSGHQVALETQSTHPYRGAFYIRTDAAAGGWNNFRQESNLMTYSTYADAHEHFDHYFCKWILAGSHIEFTIANDYSYCISDTIESDEIINHNNDNIGHLPIDANIRFGWDSKTNETSRAYIGGSGHKKDRFLVLKGNEHMKDLNGNAFTGNTAEGQDRYNLVDHEVVFEDKNNWIYQIEVKATTDARITLTADLNGKTQYFKGQENAPVKILESDITNKQYKIRFTYDFKTNHLVVAWLPDEKIGKDTEIVTDLMLIRQNHEQATQIQFTNSETKLWGIQKAYGVTTFQKTFLTDATKSQEERLLYWVSFPFDVWLKDVFGFGEYGQHWIMEYYDGESRAQNGYWADSNTYWKYITNPDYKLKAGQGYVLCLSTGLLNANHAAYKEGVADINLYFPSIGTIEEITSAPTSTDVPAHTCTIERDNRNIYDSNWNLIGVPGYADITNITINGKVHTEVEADGTNFYYAYQPTDNTYIVSPTNTSNFQSLHAYMVQFAGTINWTIKTFPSSIAARRAGEMPSEHTLRLELAQGEDKADQTIIKLQEQDATADFDMNIDMTKIKNSGANIYTLTENTAIMVAGNALPMEKTTIPVGIEVANAGTYTLRMPDGTDGISVTLIDNQTGIHTDMLLSEYTITLDAGSHLNRFYIAVDPDRTATSVENVGDKAKGVEKYLIDGQLFIRTAEGIFDAQGRKL